MEQREPEQQSATLLALQSTKRSSVVTTLIGGRYVLGYAPLTAKNRERERERERETDRERENKNN